VTPTTRWLNIQPATASDGVLRVPVRVAQAISTDDGPPH
jgi:hypothetical protein